MTVEEEEKLIVSLREYKDVLTWSYKYFKGVDPKVFQHTIPMREDTKPSIQCPYSYSENFAKRIDEEIDQLKEADFIFEIKHTPWVSPLVIVPKRNCRLRVCTNLKKVNITTM